MEILIHRVVSSILVVVLAVVGYFAVFQSLEIKGVTTQIAQSVCQKNDGLERIAMPIFPSNQFVFYCKNGLRTGDVTINLTTKGDVSAPQ